MAPRRNNRANNKRPKMNRSRNIKGALKVALDGRKVTPSADPSTIVEVPWNTITLTFEQDVPQASLVVVTLNSIDNALRILYPNALPYFYRLRSARVWELSNQSISANFYSLESFSPISVSISQQDDTPGKNHWARAGYIWPRSHQNIVLNNTDQPILGISTTSTANLLIHVDILWRSNVSQLPPPAIMQLKPKFRFYQPKEIEDIPEPHNLNRYLSESQDESSDYEDSLSYPADNSRLLHPLEQ